jgi:hypothetical protein
VSSLKERRRVNGRIGTGVPDRCAHSPGSCWGSGHGPPARYSGGPLVVNFTLPMPGVSSLELVPEPDNDEPAG